jgi:hypothetical protein
MSLDKFLSFNKTCPICDRQLTLFMQWHGTTLWKERSLQFPKEGQYVFSPFKFVKEQTDTVLTLSENGADLHPIISEDRKHAMHFFYLCDEGGIEVTSESASDYEINLYKACYYRSSVDMEFRKEEGKNKKWELTEVRGDAVEVISQEESFSFKKQVEPDLERVYALIIKTLDDCTDLWFYETNAEQRAQENFEPKLFEKKMPLLPKRPDLDINHRDKLLSRLESWILMS